MKRHFLHKNNLELSFYPGNVINIQTGEWKGMMSGIGAGIDSLYEYMLKVNIISL